MSWSASKVTRRVITVYWGLAKIVFTSGSITQVTNLRYIGKRKKRQCPAV
jgi:hypothetical protein